MGCIRSEGEKRLRILFSSTPGMISTTSSRLSGSCQRNEAGRLSSLPTTLVRKGKFMKNRWFGIVGTALLIGTVSPHLLTSQTTPSPQAAGPYAVIGMMRAVDERHSVDLEAGYVRHLEWHRQVRDPFDWYSYSVSASTERQRWIIYATFGHTAAELSNPVSPAEDWRDASITLLPHVEFKGNAIYEFLPGLSRGNGMPTPTRLAEYTTVELNYGEGKVFEAALAGEQSKLQGETLWYRLVEGG